MFKIIDLTKRELIAIEVEGKLTKADYDKITPLIDKAVKDFGKVKLYIQLNNLDGIAPGAFWEDVKTYLKHFNHMKKIAVVGKSRWEKLWSDLAAPFISGEVKYFEFTAIDEAREWVKD
ncbi:SpoIIAA family protein [Draconibacterium halophilum]|uniref:STAS/SEC14 domain-containing protein n=1 Tax=Draconibacterium halophilum TaxID=2706887 RepID=A0A6C0RAJ3_9BACT|nr:STAS/SEC14 domain-containing protein [Draconibacterium halophilum]QIA07400.1 STAS/SEC14 domain-containing protein [Draconibacterium halophilum]